MFAEICRECLSITANATTVVVGSVVMITCSITQRPHNGISLLTDEYITNSPNNPNRNFHCYSMSNDVTGPVLVYFCTAKKSGTITVQSNVDFCETLLYSQQINITILEQGTYMCVCSVLCMQWVVCITLQCICIHRIRRSFSSCYNIVIIYI